MRMIKEYIDNTKNDYKSIVEWFMDNEPLMRFEFYFGEGE
jgi:hypothetical protein